jgi:hypothetical protein
MKNILITGKDKIKVSEDELKRLLLIKWCILEAIRLRAPGVITRKVVKPVKILVSLVFIYLPKLFIYSHVHTLFGSFLPPAPLPHPLSPSPLTSGQNLLCPYL